MSFYDTPLTPIRSDGSDREAPSSIVNSCQTLVRWQFGFGVACLTLTVTLPWYLLQMLRHEELLAQAMNRAPMLPEKHILIAAGIAALLPAVNAFCLFRSGAALRTFARGRLVGDLHLAVRRLRGVWRTFSISLVLVVAAIIAAVVWRWLQAQP